VPASHGGFETFAEELSLFLVSRGWDVMVYCQKSGKGHIYEEIWNGVRLICIPVNNSGSLGTIVFDLLSTWHSLRHNGINLVLGYNTAFFCMLSKCKGIVTMMNMDGIEWKRSKWSFLERLWLRGNEFIACRMADHLIADNPWIKEHLAKQVSESKITMIPYGARLVENISSSPLSKFYVTEKKYCLVIARPEPENSILEIVKAFSAKRRGLKLIVLGEFYPDIVDYHKVVLDEASDEVLFPGSVYDKTLIDCLRHYTKLYIHGHQVGGTNPSLVESLGAGSPVLAYNSCFNQWVAGDKAVYFSDQNQCESILDELLCDDEHLKSMSVASKSRFVEKFRWDGVLRDYERIITRLGGNHSETT
jgi:glycosyltransferase involved in cell wall biosynthesis